jgi:cardiolipin synthase A/B
MRQKLRAVRYRVQQQTSGKPGFFSLTRKFFWAWWFWAVAAVAAGMYDHDKLAIGFALAALLTYLMATSERAPTQGLETDFSVHSHEFCDSIAGATGADFIKHNQVTILNNGDEFYPSMLDAIRNARHTITMEAYIYWKGDIGMEFARVMAARSKAGVQVKLLLDAVGSSTIGSDILQVLKNGDCKLAWYNPVLQTTIGRFNHRNHRKSLIIDGRVAFTGGAGIADHWRGHAQDEKHWRDIQVRIEGPAAVRLQTGFTQNWLITTGELISGIAFFPPPDAAGTFAVQTILSSPDDGSSSARILFYLAIAGARETVYIENPYFVPDETATKVLTEAAARGVDVKIMVAGEHNDVKTSRYASIQLYGNLLKAGVEIYEYVPTMMHQKTMVVDGTWSTIGTTNFDNRSFALNEESNISVYDRRLAAQLEKIFMDDLKVCERVTLENWKQRGLKTRILGVLSLIFKDQI